MKFFEEILSKNIKTGYSVCGDHTICLRLPYATFNIVCDGIGSGFYANIAAVTCAARLEELLKCGVSLRSACEMIAASMHRARTEEMPFAAFSAVSVKPNGEFTVYNYEAPEAVILQDNFARAVKPRVYTVGYEMLGEYSDTLNEGDSLLLFSDGVSQAGMGRGYGFGIGSSGIADFINKSREHDIRSLPRAVTEMTKSICENRFEDDTTLSALYCRQANELTILTGPPSKPTLDKTCVLAFMDAPGKKVVCGSTTTEIVSRELSKPVTMQRMVDGVPPEYAIEGIDLTAEGAIMLNQTLNILDLDPNELTGETVVEKFCQMLHDADVIRVIVGNAANDAHDSIIFKQIGVKVRRAVVNTLKEKLDKMGKLVIETGY